MNATSDTPPELDDASPAAKRIYDALKEADSPLTRLALENRTYHAKTTVNESLKLLRNLGLVERNYLGPTPHYQVSQG